MLTDGTHLRTGTERIQNGYENANGTDTERIPNGNGTDTERLRITKMEKSILQNANYMRTRSSEHMVVSYAIRVLTEDLEMM